MEQRLHRLEGAVGKRALDSGLVTLQGNNGSGRGATSGAAGGGGDGGGDISVGVSGGGGGGGHGGEKSLAACLSSLQQRVGRLEPETVVKARKELAPLQKALEQVHVCFFFFVIRRFNVFLIFCELWQRVLAQTHLGPQHQKTLFQSRKVLAEQKRQAGSSGSTNTGSSATTTAQTQALFKRTMAIDDFGPDLPALVRVVEKLW